MFSIELHVYGNIYTTDTNIDHIAFLGCSGPLIPSYPILNCYSRMLEHTWNLPKAEIMPNEKKNATVIRNFLDIFPAAAEGCHVITICRGKRLQNGAYFRSSLKKMASYHLSVQVSTTWYSEERSLRKALRLQTR